MKFISICVSILAVTLYAVQFTGVSFNNGSKAIEGADHNLNVVIGEQITGSTENDSYNFRSGYISVITGVHEIQENQLQKPDDFAIVSAYPNPFNSQCKVEFSLNEPDIVEISIFTVDGKRIMLNSNNMTADFHTIVWDADDVESGIYIMKISNSEQSITQKLILIR